MCDTGYVYLNLTGFDKRDHHVVSHLPCYEPCGGTCYIGAVVSITIIFGTERVIIVCIMCMGGGQKPLLSLFLNLVTKS